MGDSFQAMTQTSPAAIIALGANLPSKAGSPVATILAASQALQTLSATPLQLSSLYESDPVDCEPGAGPFINAVARIHSRFADPLELLTALQGLEQQYGRERREKYESSRYQSRPLDLDLISFGSLRRNTPRLTVPHPRALEREFVLRPLADLEPKLRFPGIDETVEEALAALQSHAGLATRKLADSEL